MDYTPTPEEIEAFTDGDCWHLALQMHKMTGAPVVFANPVPETDEYWEHVGLLISPRRVLDIEGITPIHLWREKWADDYETKGVTYMRTQTADIKFLVSEQDRFFSHISSRKTARKLLKTHAKELLV